MAPSLGCRRVDADMSGREQYYKDWYNDNHSEVLDKRRSRYSEDPEYAKQCRERSREYRQRVKNGAPVRKMPRGAVTIMVEGQECRAWTIGHVAKTLDRSIATINWVRNGLVPDIPIQAAGEAVHGRNDPSSK